jgi:hypothetical protein
VSVFDEKRREAMKRWYDRPETLEGFRKLYDAGQIYEAEQYVRQDALLPLTFRDQLPDWLRNEEGEPLFTVDMLHPGTGREGWAEAVEIGWSVIEKRLGVKQADVIAHIEKEQEDDWNRFMASVEERKRRRGEATSD